MQSCRQQLISGAYPATLNLTNVTQTKPNSISTFILIFCIFFFNFQNGYPSRRRSLVDDARFESLVVKQTKQTVLEEARSKANGKSILSLNLKNKSQTCCHSFSIY